MRVSEGLRSFVLLSSEFLLREAQRPSSFLILTSKFPEGFVYHRDGRRLILFAFQSFVLLSSEFLLREAQRPS